MSITAKVHIEHDRLALVPTLRRLDGVEIKVITQGTTDPGGSNFPFLVEYEDRGAVEGALADDATVASYDIVDWTDGTGIYYVEHTDDTVFISTAVTAVNGFLLHTETRGNGWLVHLVLPERTALRSVWEYAADNGITLDIVEVYDNESVEGTSSYNLTAEQRVALEVAYDAGYFEEPRRSSLSEVADEFGLSSTAMNGRLRRGMANLIAATIVDDADEE